MPTAKPKPKSHKRKKNPPRSQHPSPNSKYGRLYIDTDDETPIAPPGGPYDDAFATENEQPSSDLDAPVRPQLEPPSRCKTRPRKRRLIARWDSSTGEDTDSDIRRKPSNWDAHQGGDQQDGRDDDDQQDGRDDSEEACQDGLGDPNTSGITPPIPTNLVEPNLAGHENAIHVVTSGLEVGLFTNKGIADARLYCQNPSRETFSTWALATAYYTECFVDGSVRIQPPFEAQMPLISPSFDSPTGTPKAKGKSRAVTSPNSPYAPLSFPSSPESLSRIINRRKVLHTGLQNTPRKQVQVPKGHTPSPTPRLLSPFIPKASSSRHVYVDDDSDEESGYAALLALTTAMPTPISAAAGGAKFAPSSSLVVERHNSPIVISDSDSAEEVSAEDEYVVSDIEFDDQLIWMLDNAN